jgi:hypothetical protein
MTRTLFGALVLLLAAGQAQAQDPPVTETLVLRELSIRTYSSTLNDDRDHPVQKIDDLAGPKPIGPGRGAGTWVFINNKLVDYTTGADAGFMRGMCWTVDHGPDGPWKGKLWAGVGGPFHSSCQLNYVLKDGQVVATGDLDMEAVERNVPATIPIVGGTGRYRAASGELTFQQDPPDQPITYKVTISVDHPSPKRAALTNQEAAR